MKVLDFTLRRGEKRYGTVRLLWLSVRRGSRSKTCDVRVQRGWASGLGASAFASGFHGLALAGAFGFTPKSQT